MTGLREKIVFALVQWRGRVVDEIFSDEPTDKTGESLSATADHILAMLPQMPELRWEDRRLFYDGFFVGAVWSFNTNLYLGAIVDPGMSHLYRAVANGTTEAEARAAVEKAAREAIGWRK